MRIAFLLTLLLLAPNALAGEPGATRAAIEIEARADHVVVPVALVADLEAPLARLDALSSAIKSIRSAFSAAQGTRVETDNVTLSAYRSEKLSFSSGSSSSSSASLYIFGELAEDGDIFSKTKEVHETLGEIALPEDVRMRIGTAFLGVTDPEAYRGRLLKGLRDQLDLTRETLGDLREIRIRGLDKAVRVSPKNDTEVILYLDYSYEMEM